MLSCNLESRKNSESKNPNVTKTKKGKPMLLSKCALCDSNKSRFIKEQEASGFLEDIGKAII